VRIGINPHHKSGSTGQCVTDLDPQNACIVRTVMAAQQACQDWRGKKERIGEHTAKMERSTGKVAKPLVSP
jgi:hypothetical protein